MSKAAGVFARKALEVARDPVRAPGAPRTRVALAEESVLGGLRVSSPAATPIARPSRGARTPRRLLGARSLEELRQLIGTVLAGLYQDDARFELYVGVRGRLEPVAEPEAVPSRASGQLLASVTMRLAVQGHALAEAHALPALHHLRRGPVVTAPLLDAQDELIGLLVVEAPFGARDYTRLHVTALEGIAALAAAAVQRLRPTLAERFRARVELDRQAARVVQRRLMSGSLPQGTPVTAFAEYLPALDVGGDFYSLGGGHGTVTAAIGDVSGHGVSAALVMSRVASEIERALASGTAPAAVLGDVNARLSDVDSETFVTASCVRLDTRSGKLTVANAGHLPLVVRRAGGEVFTCGGASGVPLGMLPCTYADEEIVLGRGDIVLLMTDGLVEALDYPSGERGLDLLAELVGRGPHDAGDLHARIGAVVAEARRTHPADDVTWVVLQVAA